MMTGQKKITWNMTATPELRQILEKLVAPLFTGFDENTSDEVAGRAEQEASRIWRKYLKENGLPDRYLEALKVENKSLEHIKDGIRQCTKNCRKCGLEATLKSFGIGGSARIKNKR